jgi:hypothetical protein
MKNRLAGVAFVPSLFGGVLIILGGVRVAASNIALGLLMIAIGGCTVVLVVRMMRGGAAAVDSFETTGELNTPHFDYLIWSALVVPMLLVVALLVLAISGALTNK